MDEKFKIIGVTNDDGTHSHFALIECKTGEKIWSENPEECKAQGFPVKSPPTTGTEWPTNEEIKTTAKGYSLRQKHRHELHDITASYMEQAFIDACNELKSRINGKPVI